jgi:tRNA(His) 5'-end guanylyltransferase
MKSLGDRMKESYELRQRHYLTARTPVIVRVDGRAFHTYTKGFVRPFDNQLMSTMVNAATDLFEDMQGCKLAYIQSDEASFVLTDYDNLDTQGWFNYNQSKIESISAAQMTMAFNRRMTLFGRQATAVFDARAHNIPRDEVANYFLWRTQDWHRNSMSMFAQHRFSHKDLHGKSISDMHEMLHLAGLNWTTDVGQAARNGTFLYREDDAIIEDTAILPNYRNINLLWEDVQPEEKP